MNGRVSNSQPDDYKSVSP